MTDSSRKVAARMDFTGRKATVVGLGREGLDLVRFLVARGAEVTVSDSQSATALRGSLERVADLPLRLSLGANRVEDLLGADIVFVSPGVPMDLPAVNAAAEKGIPISSETQLFFQLCPAPILGITGSSGKTTTTSLLGEVFRRAGREVLVGGNIGVPLLGRLDAIAPHAWVVLELSSFQLVRLRQSPPVAVVTNVTPNHLDKHPSMEHYVEAKKNILRYQSAGDRAILNVDNALTRAMVGDCRGDVLLFSRQEEVETGAWLQGEWLMVRWQGQVASIAERREIRLRGEHNIENVLAVAAAAAAAGTPAAAVRAAVLDFEGVEHRLELVRTVGSVSFYNDSIATTPERSLAALRSFREPIVLLAGGREKHLPLADWAGDVVQRCRAVVLFGEAAGLLADALGAARSAQRSSCLITHACSLAEAVERATKLALAGDVVLLSPACTSFDAFRDFEERGRAFRGLVGALEGKPEDKP